jgi:hypothetical protein
LRCRGSVHPSMLPSSIRDLWRSNRVLSDTRSPTDFSFKKSVQRPCPPRRSFSRSCSLTFRRSSPLAKTLTSRRHASSFISAHLAMLEDSSRFMRVPRRSRLRFMHAHLSMLAHAPPACSAQRPPEPITCVLSCELIFRWSRTPERRAPAQCPEQRSSAVSWAVTLRCSPTNPRSCSNRFPGSLTSAVSHAFIFRCSRTIHTHDRFAAFMSALAMQGRSFDLPVHAGHASVLTPLYGSRSCKRPSTLTTFPFSAIPNRLSTAQNRSSPFRCPRSCSPFDAHVRVRRWVPTSAIVRCSTITSCSPSRCPLARVRLSTSRVRVHVRLPPSFVHSPRSRSYSPRDEHDRVHFV